MQRMGRGGGVRRGRRGRRRSPRPRDVPGAAKEVMEFMAVGDGGAVARASRRVPRPRTASRSRRICPVRTSTRCCRTGHLPVVVRVRHVRVPRRPFRGIMQSLRQVGQKRRDAPVTRKGGVRGARNSRSGACKAEGRARRRHGAIVGVHLEHHHHIWGEQRDRVPQLRHRDPSKPRPRSNPRRHSSPSPSPDLWMGVGIPVAGVAAGSVCGHCGQPSRGRRPTKRPIAPAPKKSSPLAALEAHATDAWGLTPHRARTGPRRSPSTPTLAGPLGARPSTSASAPPSGWCASSSRSDSSLLASCWSVTATTTTRTVRRSATPRRLAVGSLLLPHRDDRPVAPRPRARPPSKTGLRPLGTRRWGVRLCGG